MKKSARLADSSAVLADFEKLNSKGLLDYFFERRYLTILKAWL